MSDVRLLRHHLEQALEIARGRMDKPLLINHLESAMAASFRKPPTRKTTPRSERMTKSLALKIQASLRKYKRWSYQEIADLHGVNQGRVSEVARGEWL